MTEPIDYEKQDIGILDNLIEGFQLIGFDWRYLYANKSVVTQSKYTSRKDLIGFTMMEKYPGIENSALFGVLKRCMKERVAQNIENEFLFPDGSKGYFELRIEPVPEGLFILSMDITEQKKAAQAKEAHINVLEEMIFMISHKVRQPVAHILGFSDVLKNMNLTNEELLKIATYMKQSIHTLDDFTKELTTFIHEQKLKASK